MVAGILLLAHVHVGGEGADFAEGAYFPIFSRLLYDEICPFEIYSLLASLD